MAGRTIVPFGPQHPVLPEPLQLKLVLEDEKVVEAIPAIGYVHRGLEKLGERKDYKQNVFLVERICGICSFMHALCYCQGIEELMNVTVPDRARYLRVVWGELHRLHSHHLWLGLLADSFGFESLFMQAWRNRELIMDVLENTTGNRVIISVCEVGGVRRDLNEEQITLIQKALDSCEKEMDRLVPAILNDYSVKHRTQGIGVLSKQEAYELGAVGPVARGSGVGQDLRTLGYAAYRELDFKPVVAEGGDCYARTVVRLQEIYASIELIREALNKLPPGDVTAKVAGRPTGEVAMRVEQPRGECMYYIRANGTDKLDRLRVRTPTFANVPPLLKMLPGCQLADVPVIVLSIDPCISCTER